MKDTVCKDHPDAPHSFDRNASLSEDRYVCECESWEPPKDRSWPSLIKEIRVMNGRVIISTSGGIDTAKELATVLLGTIAIGFIVVWLLRFIVLLV